LLVAVSGSVVAMPLVGWVPVHPPDAAQVCASFALHRNVADVPMATVLLSAVRVTAGFAVLLGTGVDWPDDDCWHAANAENAAHPSAQRIRRDVLTKLVVPGLLLNWVSRAVFRENSDHIRGPRATNLIMHLPSDLYGRRLPRITRRRAAVIRWAT
jgi:hypothetical protein